MAYDEGLAQLMRDALVDVEGISEKKMFGGIAFMLNGNMLCGVHTSSGMARVGKDNYETALAMEGVGPMAFTGRPMGGMVDAEDEVWDDDDRREALLALCFEFVRGLPAK